MSTFNPYAIYVRCDGGMDYDSKNTGGIGFAIEFPDFTEIKCIKKSLGRYEGANIERIELNAILKGMTELLKFFVQNRDKLKNINTIVVVTDRYSLNDNQKTNPYKIKEYRRNGWKNHEGKPVKNEDLLDSIDKMRKKISDQMRCSVKIEYNPRKQNKVANNLAKAGKKKIIVDRSIKKKGVKICKRKFDGEDIDYSLMKQNSEIIVRIFKKELVGEQWEICAEIFGGSYLGRKIKIYVDKKLEDILHRTHVYKVKIKKVYKYHLEIFRTIMEIKNNKKIK